MSRVVLLLFFLAGLSSRASELEARFDEANKLYEGGKYTEAVAAYNQMLGTGRASAALYYNRGNALLKAGQLGRAIASYRLALQTAPRDGDVRASLQFARTQARGGAAYHEGLADRWLGALALNEWAALAATLVWMFFLLLAAREWRPKLFRNPGWWLGATGAGLVLAGAGLAGALERDYLATTAVVTTGEAEIHDSPFEESAAAFKVRDGIELEVVDRKDNWLRVVDDSGRNGWIRQDEVLLLGAATRPAGGG